MLRKCLMMENIKIVGYVKNYLKKKLELVGKTKPDKADEVVAGVR